MTTRKDKIGEHQIDNAKKKAAACFSALEKAEQDFRPGIEFGRAMTALRKEVKAAKGLNWMTVLEELGIPYETARYWMAKVEGKPTDRHSKKADSVDWREDWTKATARFHEVADAIIMLTDNQPDGCEPFKGELMNLAEVLGYELKVKNA
jgi:hypothetical protein